MILAEICVPPGPSFSRRGKESRARHFVCRLEGQYSNEVILRAGRIGAEVAFFRSFGRSGALLPAEGKS